MRVGAVGFRCDCSPGFAKTDADDGECLNVDECASGVAKCHGDARCSDTDGSYACVCLDGFTGDGFNCSDVDECSLEGASPCSDEATCTNTRGGYRCECKAGYQGDGLNCTGESRFFNLRLNKQACKVHYDMTKPCFFMLDRFELFVGIS